jgi:hypothetical protein
MSKMKHRKRLTIITVVFMLVFLIGATFAFTPGTLAIAGVANVNFEPDELNVVWGDGRLYGGPDFPARPGPWLATTYRVNGFNHGVRAGSGVDDWDTPFVEGGIWSPAGTPGNNRGTAGRSDQFILWMIDFNQEAGYAVLNATPFNESLTNYAHVGAGMISLWDGRTNTMIGEAEAEALFGITFPASAYFDDILWESNWRGYFQTIEPNSAADELVRAVVAWDGVTYPPGFAQGADNPALMLIMTFDYWPAMP